MTAGKDRVGVDRGPGPSVRACPHAEVRAVFVVEELADQLLRHCGLSHETGCEIATRGGALQLALHGDIKVLGLRARRGHDLRRKFITLAQVDGARKEMLEAISYGPRGNIR